MVAVAGWVVATALLSLTLLPAFAFWVVLAFAFVLAVSVVGLAVVYAGQGAIPATPLTRALVPAVRWTVTLLVVAVLLSRVRAVLRDRLRAEADAVLADTVRPASDSGRAVRRLVQRLCQQVDQPTPTLRVRETGAPLCYTIEYPGPGTGSVGWRSRVTDRLPVRAVGSDGETSGRESAPAPSGPVLVVSTGLVAALPETELAAVLAHEVGHLRNRDLTLTTWLLVPVHWSEELLDGGDRGVVRRLLVAAPATLGTAVALAGAAPFSRGREYAADAAAAELTGDPVALASALERLDGVERPGTDLRAVHALNVLPTLDEGWTARLSHPPTGKRVERLRNHAASLEG